MEGVVVGRQAQHIRTNSHHGNIVFPHAVKEGLTILLNGAEQPITLLKEHLQSSMPHNFAKQAIWILKSCAERRFF